MTFTNPGTLKVLGWKSVFNDILEMIIHICLKNDRDAIRIEYILGIEDILENADDCSERVEIEN